MYAHSLAQYSSVPTKTPLFQDKKCESKGLQFGSGPPDGITGLLVLSRTAPVIWAVGKSNRSLPLHRPQKDFVILRTAETGHFYTCEFFVTVPPSGCDSFLKNPFPVRHSPILKSTQCSHRYRWRHNGKEPFLFYYGATAQPGPWPLQSSAFKHLYPLPTFSTPCILTYS